MIMVSCRDIPARLLIKRFIRYWRTALSWAKLGWRLRMPNKRKEWSMPTNAYKRLWARPGGFHNDKREDAEKAAKQASINEYLKEMWENRNERM